MTKTILSSACLLVCLLAATTPSFGAEMSVMQYMELEDAAVNKDTGSPVVNVYLMGMLDSYGIANADFRAVRNLIHCSDQVSEAEREIKIWFSEKELLNYTHISERMLYDVNLDGFLE